MIIERGMSNITFARSKASAYITPYSQILSWVIYDFKYPYTYALCLWHKIMGSYKSAMVVTPDIINSNEIITFCVSNS
jgi:hypothetical protein